MEDYERVLEQTRIFINASRDPETGFCHVLKGIRFLMDEYEIGDDSEGAEAAKEPLEEAINCLG